MKKKNITIEDLAIMIHKGFEETAKKKEIDARFKEVDKRFEQVDRRFDKIENLIIVDHKQRINKLEVEVRELKNLFAIK